MKRIPFLFLSLALLFLVAASRESAANPQTSLVATNVTDAKLAPGFALAAEPHKIISRGESQRIWEQVKYLTNFNLPVPRVEIITNRYTELGAGICFQQPDGNWTDSQARFVLAADGSVEATEIPHKVRISPELHSIAAVKMTLPDGRLMSSTFRGLYLHDPGTQQRLLVSDITNSVATLVASNVIVYSNCFTSLKGDLVLKVTPAGLAQDVVIRESLAWIPFDEIAFDPQSTVLEAWTEFYESPTPEKQTNTLPARAVAEGPVTSLSDDTLKFGDVLMVPGRAYPVPSVAAPRESAVPASRDSIPVGKTWIEQSDRRFLIERLRWREVLPHFKRLETNALEADRSAAFTPLRSTADIPPKLLASTTATTNRTILLAHSFSQSHAPTLSRSAPDTSAFVLDYTTVTCSGGICNGYRFEGNGTYFISSPITINGEATLVGGSVIKIADYETEASITFNGTVKCETGPGRMVIVTCKDDNSVGSVIAQSTGDPTSGFYGVPALRIGSTAPATELSYLRISYMFEGVYSANSWLGNSAWHCQFFSCGVAFVCDNTFLQLYNVLFDHVDTPFHGGNCTITGQHVTAHHASALSYDWGGPSHIYLDNSLVVGIPNGIANEMHSTPNPPSVWLTADTPGVFQTSVLGAHYLAPDSPYRGFATANIDARLRQSLKDKTTHAPTALPATISGSLVVSPTVPRNDPVYPDLGYSYDAVDYIAQGTLVQSGTLLATNGVVIGLDAGALSSGIRVAPGAKFISEGNPINMNRFVELRSVQEQHGNTVAPIFNGLEQQFSSSTSSELRLRFTDLPWRAGIGWHISRGGGPGIISLQDCQMSYGGMYANAGGNYDYTFALTNNLFRGSQFTVSGGTGTHLHLWNNTFLGGDMTLYSPNSTWNAHDNLFHQMTFLYASGSFDNDYNAYYQTTPLSTGSGNAVLSSAPSFAPGPLGGWYLAENSGNASLRNGGRSPTAAGLYHHTTRVNQNKAGLKAPDPNRNNQVWIDIGFHYVAVESDNFALRKYATQSTTESGRTADRAVDGNTDGTAAGGSVSQTQIGNSPWWQLDLGLPEQIHVLNIWNRTDCCQSQLHSLSIFVSDDPFLSPYPSEIIEQPGVSYFFVGNEVGRPTSVPIGRSGQHIKVFGTSSYLSMAEFEVRGPPRAMDKEKDGLPDYFEDRDGDGNVDSGESDFNGPLVLISSPVTGLDLDSSRINVLGSVTHNSILRSVMVNGIRAFLSGNTFEALNVPLAPGANAIFAEAEDFNGNRGSAVSTLNGTPAGATLQDPIQLQATPFIGFAPLLVSFEPAVAAPGAILQVLYDFNGDYQQESVSSSVAPATYSYEAGTYFPVLTVQTTVGRFSSIGGFNLGGIPAAALKIRVSHAPVTTAMTVDDPADVKVMPNGDFYVLSRAAATIWMYDANQTLIRSKESLGSTPTGFDVANDGTLYVALSGNHQVYKLMPQGNTFAPAEFTFLHSSKLGHPSGLSGSAAGQFNAPSDVAVSPDGTVIFVSDTGNHRVSTFDATGRPTSSLGTLGPGWDQFSAPKGLSLDGAYLFLADSAHNQIATILDQNVNNRSGSAGSAAGQFQSPNNVQFASDAVVIADTGNNRVQVVDKESFEPRYLLSTFPQFQLSQPLSAAIRETATLDYVYIADTGNNRVRICQIPKVLPAPIWVAARSQLIAHNIEGALAEFASTSVESYRAQFTSIGAAVAAEYISQITDIHPVYVHEDSSLYWFANTIDNTAFTFYIKFVLENGKWKIRSF